MIYQLVLIVIALEDEMNYLIIKILKENIMIEFI